MTEEFSYFELHSVDFGEKAADRRVVIFWVGLGLPQVRDLILEAPDAFDGDLQFLIGRYHCDPATISIIPR